MKPFALAFSIYILVLAALPCADGPEDHCMQQVNQCQTDNTNHPDDIDHCSPFCTCNCCVSPIVVAQTFIVYFDCSCLLQEFRDSYPTNNIATVNIPFWQPPKTA